MLVLFIDRKIPGEIFLLPFGKPFFYLFVEEWALG